MKKYFGTDGIRGPVGQAPITADWILKLGFAAGTVFAEASKGQRVQILIGKDTRISGNVLEAALQAGLISAGVDILLLGSIPTPAIAYLTRDLKANAGIVISASHNPFQDNGIKFFDNQGYKLSDTIESRIEAEWEKPFSSPASKSLGKALRIKDAEARYIQFCQNSFPKNLSLKGMKIVLDCANGSTYRVAPKVFRSLGATVIKLAVRPNGFNINDHCGSTFPDRLIKSVIEKKGDLGIAFDGDGDRVLMVDNQGELLDGDVLLYVIAKWYAKSNRLKGGVVGTLMSNLALEQAIQNLGLSFARSLVGDHHILEMAQKKGWNLGGESSGHILCLDSNTTGDGIISALQVLAASLSMGLSLSELKKAWIPYPQCLINVPLSSGHHSVLTLSMKEALLDNAEIKAAIVIAEKELGSQGRVLVRASGTEPLIRVMVEGQDTNLVQGLAQKLVTVIKDNLNQSEAGRLI